LADSEGHGKLIELTADIVAAYLTNNAAPPSDIHTIIASVHQSLGRLGQGAVAAPVAQLPAVPIKKSIHPDYLVCLEDGKKLKMLRRHLRVSFGLTPEQYRAKWGLPIDYPMTAPNYTAGRSAFAKKVGFGTKKARAAARARAGKK
jgi:predicted transcriptional regulator